MLLIIKQLLRSLYKWAEVTATPLVLILGTLGGTAFVWPVSKVVIIQGMLLIVKTLPIKWKRSKERTIRQL